MGPICVASDDGRQGRAWPAGWTDEQVADSIIATGNYLRSGATGFGERMVNVAMEARGKVCWLPWFRAKGLVS